MQTRPSYLSSLEIPTSPSVLPSLRLLENYEPPLDNTRRMAGPIPPHISDSMISPRAYIQTSLKMIKSPRGSAQSIHDLARPIKSTHDVGKQKRNTMPPSCIFPSSQHVHVQATGEALTPSSKPKRINFIYMKS